MKNKKLGGIVIFIAIVLVLVAITINYQTDKRIKNNRTTAFRNINVFDGNKLIEECTVLVQDSIITAVGKNIKIPSGAEIINGEGCTLMPGLIDAHVHIVSLRDLKQAAIFGVTTVLDMMTTTEFMQQARRRVKNPQNINMADFFSAGQPATYPGGHGTEWGTEIPTLTSVEDVMPFMDASVANGVDYIKIMSGLGKKVIGKHVIAALADESVKRGLLSIVHIETYDKAYDAVLAGVNGLGHSFADTIPDKAIIELMKEKKAFVIPTLSVMNNLPDAKKIDYAADDRFLRFLSPEILEAIAVRRPYRGNKLFRYHNAEATARILYEAGIPVLVGTDSYNPGTVHGVSMHGELELLVITGIPPIDVLRSATSLTANTFHLDDRGVIAKGKRADLLMIKGNPVEDITNTRNIVGVWLNGNKLDRDSWFNEMQQKQREWKESGEVPGPVGFENSLICNFDHGDFIPEFGTFFFAMSDKFFGGNSNSLIQVMKDGMNHTDGSLMVSGTIDQTSGTSWAGAAFFPSEMESSLANLSDWNAVSFAVKGDVDSCMVMFMLSDQMTPISKSVAIEPGWKEITVPFEELGSKEGKNIMAIILGRQKVAGNFNIQFDDVKLVKKFSD